MGVFAAAPVHGQSAFFDGAATTLNYSFNYPEGIAIDGSGNIYVANTQGKTVLELTNCIYGADCTATQLGGTFNVPAGVAVDNNGNIYVADAGYPGGVYEMPPGCTSSNCRTLLGGSIEYAQGVAVDGSGNVYVAAIVDGLAGTSAPCAGSGCVYEMPPGCSSPTCVKTLGGVFYQPTGVAVDAGGNIYVADKYVSSGASQVYEMTAGCTSSSCVTTLGAGFYQPTGIAVDASGAIYVADSGNGMVKKMPPGCASAGCVTALVGGFDGGVSEPWGVALDKAGHLFGSDQAGLVKEIQQLSVNFGPSAVGSPSFPPDYLTLYFTFTSSESNITASVMTQGASGLDFTDYRHLGTCDTNGVNHSYSAGDSCTVIVLFAPQYAGERDGAVQLSNASGVIATSYLQGTGVGPQLSFLPGTEKVINGTSLSGPHGIAVDGSGNIYVSEDNDVEKETYSNGSYTQTTIASGFMATNLLAVDGAGNLYITELNKTVWKETPTGSGYTQSVVDSGFGFYGVAVDGAGNVYIADAWNGQILKETPTAGGYTRSTVVTGLSNCVAVAVDGEGNLYIASDGRNGSGTLLKETLSAGGYTATALPIEGSVAPYSVTVDGIGNVYFADALSYNVYKETLTPSGYVESAVVTDLHDILGPYGLAVDGSGKLYIAYLGGHSIVVADFGNPPSLNFASTPVGSISADSPQTVTLTNIGNADLTFPIPASGNNPSITSNFTLDENAPSACPVTNSGSSASGTLAAGASCVLPISFAPTTVGSLSGSLVLTDNNLNAPAPAYATQTVALNGTSTPPVPAVMISPAPGGTLAGPITTFTWTAGSGGTTTYYLWVGTSSGTNNLVNAGLHTTSFTAMLPTNGAPLYVRLWTEINGQFLYHDYTYTESSAGPATMVSPTPGSTLTGPGTTFTWTTGPAGTSAYYLWVGTAFGTNNLVNMGLHTTSLTVTLPTNGVPLYVRLWTVINGVFVYRDYTYSESSAGPAAMVSPTPGTALSGSVTTFTWATGPAGTTTYYLWVGTAFGTNNLVNIGLHTTSLTVTLPTNGATLYVRLWTVINGVFVYKDYTYTEFNAGQAMVIAPPSELGLRRDLFLEGA